MRQTKSKKIITKKTEYIPMTNIKSTNCGINIIEGSIRGFDITTSQYIDYSFMIDKYYQLNTNIQIILVLETKLNDSNKLVKFKLDMKQLNNPSNSIEHEFEMLPEGSITNEVIHSFKLKKIEENQIYMCRLTRVRVPNGHLNGVWIHGIKLQYNVSNC